MVYYRIMYRMSRCWRCYFLLLIASVLSFFLLYLGQTDPTLETYLPYYKYFMNGKPVDMQQMMESSHLDYEYLNANSKFCLRPTAGQPNNAILFQSELSNLEEDYNLLIEDSGEDIKSNAKTLGVRIIFLVISQAFNFNNRHAIRQSWAKQLNSNVKCLFVVGNQANSSKFDSTKLAEEMGTHKDLIQIDMPDHENFTSAKTLIAIRWTVTYCSMTENVFVLSDSAVLNVNAFEKSVLRPLGRNNSFLDDFTLAGYCNYTDEKFAFSLRHFFKDAYKNRKNQMKTVASLVSKRAVSTQSLKASSTGLPTNNSVISTKRLSYKGQYCSNLGWLISFNGAKRLWLTAQRTSYMMKISPAYLNGYLAFKANLKHSHLFKYHDSVPVDTNCLIKLENEPDTLICAENFTIKNRYNNYIATWNSAAQVQFGMAKL